MKLTADHCCVSAEEAYSLLDVNLTNEKILIRRLTAS